MTLDKISYGGSIYQDVGSSPVTEALRLGRLPDGTLTLEQNGRLYVAVENKNAQINVGHQVGWGNAEIEAPPKKDWFGRPYAR
jgi:hypothetical protein